MPARDPPILELSNDILYLIFCEFKSLYPWMLRGNSERPLTIIQRCSQVCRRWRDIISGSAAIWGRLIDLDLLRQKEDHWRNEVLRRSGDSALLWIIGSVCEKHSGVEKFLLRVLKERWHRIEVVDISLDEDSPIRKSALELFSRPAPALRRFSFILNSKRAFSIHRKMVLTPTLPLFADHAPVLREFCTLHIPPNLSAPWFTNLREFQTVTPHHDFLLFNALASMPFLEIFSADGKSLHDLSTEQPILYKTQIQLPRLRMITLQGSLRTCLALAGCITPAPGCELLFEALYLSGVALSRTTLLPSFHSTIHRWLANFLDHNKLNTTIEFRIESLGSKLSIGFPSANRSFRVRVKRRDGPFDGQDLPHLLSPLKPFSSPSHFSRMKELRLELSSPNDNTPPIADFLLTLSSIERMQTEHRTIGILRELCDDYDNEIGAFLPLLQKLTVKEGPFDAVQEDFVDIIKYFLQHRQDIGRQVQSLELLSIRISSLAEISGIIGTTEVECRKEFGHLVTEMKWREIDHGDYEKYLLEEAGA